MRITKNITVFGKVQGVFFRASTKEKADEIGIVGTVRNQSDGSVFIEATGEEDTLEEFIKWCHIGPKASRVDRVETEEQALKEFESFKIVRF